MPLFSTGVLPLILLSLGACFEGFDSFKWERPKRLSSAAPLVDFVDPFIGTSGIFWASGHLSPAATVPFGTVKLGPDTSLLGKSTSHSGYAHNEPEIVGFSLNRYSGTGVGEGGLLRVKPINGSSVVAWDTFIKLRDRRYIPDKRSEMAHPGYYSVYLHSEKTQVELSASKRAGIHRYTFSKAKPRLAIELSSGHKGAFEDFTVALSPNGFTGFGLLKAGFSGRYHGLPVYFAAELNHTIQEHRFVSSKSVSSSPNWPDSGDEKVFLDLVVDAEAEEPVELRIGISHTSLAAAQAHLNSVSGSLETVRTSAEDAWQNVLERIEVVDDNNTNKKIFYSALYHSFLMPTEFADESGSFYGADKQVHANPGHVYYSDFSLWDTFRTVHPLYSLIARSEHEDMLKSLLVIYQQSGRLTRWFSGAGHTGSMLGVPSVITLSEAFLKGLGGFDQTLALTAMRAALDPTIKTKGKECLRAYVELGYCAAPYKGSVSYTLEYAYGDHSLGLYAEAQNEPELAQFYLTRAKLALRKQFDKRHVAFLPRLASGDFEDLGPAGPSWDETSYISLGKTGRAFVEGGPRHWRFYSIYDDDLMRSLYGKHFEPLLDEMFNKAKASIGSAFPPYYYWHGNEPGFTQAYWYALNGNLAKTQSRVKWILENKYSAKASGLDGDDDAGTLSAWYVLSAMGIFPIAGTDRYIVGFPRFEKVTFDSGGGPFVIERRGDDLSRVYLNGKKLKRNVINHEDIASGGRLTFGGAN